MITIIIPARNEARNIGRCLTSLPPRVPVIVADDNSTDGTGEIVRAHGAQVVAVPPPEPGKDGLYQALMAALDAIKTPFVVWTDADTRWTAATLSRVSSAIRPGFTKLVSIRPTFDCGRGLNRLHDAMADRVHMLPHPAWGKFILMPTDGLRAGLRLYSSVRPLDLALGAGAGTFGTCITQPGLLYSRIYTTWPEAWEGWSRNVWQFLQTVRPENRWKWAWRQIESSESGWVALVVLRALLSPPKTWAGRNLI